MKVERVVIRTHGGQGNQIFQLLYGLLIVGGTEECIEIYHDDRYPHRFGLESIFKKYEGSNSFRKKISLLRLPKFLTRIKIIRIGMIRIGKTIYLDDYFQDVSNYENISKSIFSQALDRLRDEILNEQIKKNRKKLYHLRLRDFFRSQNDERNYALNAIEEMENESHVITNNEKILKIDCINKIILSKRIRVISTQGMSGTEVIKTMAAYDQIESNNSTLAFWAAIFGNSQLRVSDRMLNDLYIIFRKMQA